MEELKIFTSLKSAFYRKKMVQGILTALLGLGLIFYFGNQAFIGLLGIFLIVSGLNPLRRLSKLVQNPDELLVSGDHMHYLTGSKPFFTVPLKNISDLRYIEEANYYGIALLLRDKQDIILHDTGFNLSRFMAKSRKKTDSDLFLPYFERRSFSRLGFIKSSFFSKKK